MATSFGALCSDFYVNLKLSLKMDMPSDRETVLHMFDQVRKAMPDMDRFRRYEGELSLESSRRDREYRWMALRRTNIRMGHVNPKSMQKAYETHRTILQLVPYYLTVSPLDVDCLELMFGFDLECKSDQDQVVYEALYANSPLADLLKVPDARITDVQPVFGLSLVDGGHIQASYEVKTRTRNRRGHSRRYRDEPISIFLTLRRYGPVNKIDDLCEVFDLLADHAELLATDRVVPTLLTPISRQIAWSST